MTHMYVITTILPIDPSTMFLVSGVHDGLSIQKFCTFVEHLDARHIRVSCDTEFGRGMVGGPCTQNGKMVGILQPWWEEEVVVEAAT